MLHVLAAPASAFSRIDLEPMSPVMLASDGRRWTVRMAEAEGR